MAKKSAGNDITPLDRAFLSHAVSTLGAAVRSLSRVQGYEPTVEEVEQCLEFVTEELRVIRERERDRAEQAKQS